MRRTYFVTVVAAFTPRSEFMEQLLRSVAQVLIDVLLRSQVADRGERREGLPVDEQLVLSATIWWRVGVASDANHLSRSAAPAELNKHDGAGRLVRTGADEVQIRIASISLLQGNKMSDVLAVPPESHLLTPHGPDDTNFVFCSSAVVTFASVFDGLEVGKSKAPERWEKDDMGRDNMHQKVRTIFLLVWLVTVRHSTKKACM